MYYIPGLPWISYLTNVLTAKNDDLKFFCEYYANFIYMKIFNNLYSKLKKRKIELFIDMAYICSFSNYVLKSPGVPPKCGRHYGYKRTKEGKQTSVFLIPFQADYIYFLLFYILDFQVELHLERGIFWK